MNIGVCWKWVSVGGSGADSRWAGVSPADEAALELALTLTRTRTAAGGDVGEVTVVCVGPPEADVVLRTALSVGATRSVRIDAHDQLDSRAVAQSIGPVVADCDFVLCGDYSLDRGTGSVPAFLAHELGSAQALGLVELDPNPTADDALRVVRRLDGGRREVLAVRPPAVLSVEGSVARLRRASLAAVVAAKDAPIESRPGPPGEHPSASVVVPYRPRARSLPAPTGPLLDRVRGILDIGGSDSAHGETVVLEPDDAARRIVDQLVSWGYLAPATAGADATR